MKCIGWGIAAAGLLSPAAAPAQSFPHYAGAVHVHSKASGDAKGELAQIAGAAAGVHLDYVIVTDHNTLKHLTDRKAGYREGVLVLIGGESTSAKGHVLALNMPADPEERFTNLKGAAPQVVLDGVRTALGYPAPPGLPFIAHPFAPSWLWEDWNVTGNTGFEVINLAALFDQWRSGFIPTRHKRGPSVRAHTESILPDISDSLLKRLSNNMVRKERLKWDQMLKSGRTVVGVAAADAHFAYGHMMDTVQTYAATLEPLNGNLEHDQAQIFSAYANGRLYMVYHRASRSVRTRDFDFRASNDRETRIMGQPLLLQPGERASFTVTAPKNSHTLIRIIRHGEEVAASEQIGRGSGPTEGAVLQWSTSVPGAYRVEVFHSTRSRPLLQVAGGRAPNVAHLLQHQRGDLRPWIFSNPIYVRPDGPSPSVRLKRR
jgi:hypothetical protein